MPAPPREAVPNPLVWRRPTGLPVGYAVGVLAGEL